MAKKSLPSIDKLLAASFQRPDLEADVHLAVASAEAERAALQRVTGILKTVRMAMEEITIEDVTDPARGDALDAWHNHPAINSGMHAVVVASKRNQLAAVTFAESVNKYGAFYQQYVGETRKRIEGGMHTRTDGGGWKILVGHGRIRSNEEPFELGPLQPGAHGDFLFPADTDGAELVVPVPSQPLDVVYPLGQGVLDEILADPACAFLIADICAYPHARQKGVASKVEDAAFTIARGLNAGGRTHKLKYAVSAMANVVSVTDERGDVVWKFDPQVLNIISLVMHTKRATKPGILIGEQREQVLADIETDAGKFAINGDWYLAAQRVDDGGVIMAS
jgi:hypothetical protein